MTILSVHIKPDPTKTVIHGNIPLSQIGQGHEVYLRSVNVSHFQSSTAQVNTLMFHYNDPHFETVRFKSHYNNNLLSHYFDCDFHLGYSRGDCISFSLRAKSVDSVGTSLDWIQFDDIVLTFQIKNSFT